MPATPSERLYLHVPLIISPRVVICPRDFRAQDDAWCVSEVVGARDYAQENEIVCGAFYAETGISFQVVLIEAQK